MSAMFRDRWGGTQRLPMTVDAIIPCYNASEHVEAALASLLSQSYPLSRIICVDDGSTDETLEILKRFQQQDPERINVLSGPNRGACHARNVGLAVSRSDYVQFLDADDQLHPGKIANQVRLIQNCADTIDIVAGAYRLRRGQDTINHKNEPSDNIFLSLVLRQLGNTCANLFRRQAVVACGAWDETLIGSHETDLMFRMVLRGAKVAYDDSILTDIIAKAGSVCRTPENQVAYLSNFITVRGRIASEMRRRFPEDDAAVRRAECYIFRFIRNLYRYDRKNAVRLHHEIISRQFVPDGTGLREKLFGLSYRTVGYEQSERLRTLIAG